MFHDFVLNLVSNGVFQIQVKAKQDCARSLFHSVFATIVDLVELPSNARIWWVV